MILAGGRSKRMGADKALLEVQGLSMLDRAIHLAEELEAAETIVLGRPEHPLGIEDKEPFSGPARAVATYLKTVKQTCRILVLPIDMPFLDTIHIEALLGHPHGACFQGQYLPFAATIEPGLHFTGTRMKELLSDLRIEEMPVPEEWHTALTNVNTPSTLQGLNGT